MKKYDFELFGYCIWIRITAPKTCWWNNDWHPKRTSRMRQDTLIGLQRIYSRLDGIYIYKAILGRFKLSWGKI